MELSDFVIIEKMEKKIYEITLTHMIFCRILYRMKVTAIIDDDLVNSVRACTKSSTITEAITIALRDWLDIYHIKELNQKISQNPVFIEDGHEIREINRSI